MCYNDIILQDKETSHWRRDYNAIGETTYTKEKEEINKRDMPF